MEGVVSVIIVVVDYVCFLFCMFPFSAKKSWKEENIVQNLPPNVMLVGWAQELLASTFSVLAPTAGSQRKWQIGVI